MAKITDLGNSRIVTLSPVEVARLSFIPGTLAYMPPEMSESSSCYGPSLDVFSFGHMGLFTATQLSVGGCGGGGGWAVYFNISIHDSAIVACYW